MSRIAYGLSALALTASLGVSGCGKGTFVVVNFSSSDPSLAAKTLRCDLSLTGSSKMPQVHFTAAGDKFTFPATGSIEIESGEGTLTAKCDALDAAGKVLSSADDTTMVSKNKTSQLSIAFGGGPVDQDGGSGSLSISPLLHAFGTKVVGEQTAPFAFTITNTGAATTGGLNVTFSGQDMADFTLAGGDCVGKQLGGAESCTVQVVFAPKSAAQVKNAKLRVAAPAGTPGGFVTADLAGSAGAKGALSFSETMHDFGGQLVQTQGTDVSFTLTNTGSAPTTTITTAVDGANVSSFQTASNDCNGKTLAGGASCVVKIHFAPMARGSLTASLSATATTGGTATVDLLGTGKAPAQLVIVGGASMAARADLGTVDVNTVGTMTHTFTVRNDGDFDSGMLSIVTAANSQITSTANTTCQTNMVLAPGASCVGEVVLKPTSFGTKNEDLSLTASPGGTVSTYVTGVGRDQVTLIITQAAEGTVSDTASPHNFVCGQGQTQCTKVFTRTTAAVPVTFMATADTANYWLFNRWTGPGSPTCTEGTTSSTCSMSLDATIPAGSYTFTPNYVKQTFSISYRRQDFAYAGPLGGTTMTIVAGASTRSCTGPCTDSGSPIVVPANTMVTVTASDPVTAGAQTLRRISGPCLASSATDTAASCSFTVTSDTTVNVAYTPHNYAFVSSAQYDGNLGGQNGASMKCQALADAAKIPGTFIAVLSTSTANARDLFPVGIDGWIRVDGEPFAEDRASLLGQLTAAQAVRNFRIYRPLNLDENGGTHNAFGEAARTYSDINGIHLTDSNHCVNWTTSSDPSTTTIWQGIPSAGSGGWINGSSAAAGCSLPQRLYCMGINMGAPVPPQSAPAGAKFMFLSASKFVPAAANSRANMDSTCDNEGKASINNAFTYKALVSTSTSPAASQATAGTYPLIRPDKLVIGDRNAVLSNMPILGAAVNQLADGTYLPSTGTDGQVFSGAPNPTAVSMGGDSCNNWTNNGGTMAQGGWAYNTTMPFFGAGNFFDCATARRFYCVQQ